jgi:hypothetical protein
LAAASRTASTILGGEHQGVGVGQLSGPQVRADRPDLVPGRDHRDDRRPADGQLGHPGRARGGDVDRPQPVASRQQELGGAHVLADRAHVLVGGGRRTKLDGARALLAALAEPVHLLAHDHGIPAGRHRVPRVDDFVLVAAQRHRGRLGRADGVGGADRDAVHGGGVERRRGASRPDGLGGHAPDGLVERGPDDLEPLGAAGPTAGVDPRRERVGRRHVVDERCGASHAGILSRPRYPYSVTSTSAPAGRPVAASGTTT